MEIVWETPANPPQSRDYIFRQGRRYVRPYYFEFISHAKNRWEGKTIVDLFAEEFKGRPYDYYVDAVKSGRIQVDGQIVHASYIVRSSQKISHFLHRHEPHVLAGNVTILQNESDVVTVCKPASIPVHPCGQYRKNTVVGILQAEHGLAPLFPVHRLDRLVSGLLIFARNPDKAESFRQQIEGGLLQKEYVAKVMGVFPEAEQVVNANVNYDAREGRSSIEIAEEFAGQPLRGKVACTKFMRISTDGTHSMVLCKPVTGRTHQIRVHLQYTGHPIANDTLYLSKVVAPRSNFGSGADRAASVGMDMPLPPVSANNGNDIDSGPSGYVDSVTMEMKKAYGCIVYDTRGQIGATSAHIPTGLSSSSHRLIYFISMIPATDLAILDCIFTPSPLDGDLEALSLTTPMSAIKITGSTAEKSLESPYHA